MTPSPQVLAWFAIGVIVTRAGMDLFKPSCPYLSKSFPVQTRAVAAFILGVLNAFCGSVVAHVPVQTAITTALTTFLTALFTHQMLPDPVDPAAAGTPTSKRPSVRPPIHARRLLVGLVVFVIGCAGLGGAIKTAADDAGNACVVLQSTGVPTGILGGVICATIEELDSVADHLLAARAYKASHPALMRGGAPLDPCTVPLLPAPVDAGADANP